MRPHWAVLWLVPLIAQAASYRHDVIVYGGTAGGAAAAIAAARAGMKVALIEPGRHVGGMVTGGLGRTDMDRQEHVIGGIAREFFERVGKHYGEAVAWTFEPSVAERVFNDWLKEAHVEIYFNQRLAGVDKRGTAIQRLLTVEGSSFAGAVFIDGTYEGDLMKAAGVTYTVGREARSLYAESLAGRQDFLPGRHQIKAPIRPYRADGEPIYPYLVPQEKLEDTGEGDAKFQAYCFRLCLTNRPENRLAFPEPPGYSPDQYAIVRAYIEALGNAVQLNDFLGISPMPNGKTDVNATVISTNLVGANWEYPEASYERRREIWDQHLRWAQGLVYFLANDSSVPERLREEMKQWGLPKDEFLDTGHWPHQLYVREARRMLGEYVLTQHDLQTRREKYDSIGMAGYNIDIREVQWVARTVYRFPNAAKEVLMEGYVSVPVDPWQIPYRALLPQQQEASNLLVPVCVSASQVAFASFRMEPQFMIAGHAAGTAAALALQSKTPVHHVSIPQLHGLLKEQKQILTLESAAATAK